MPNQPRFKYGRTFHLPYSLGITSDDKVLSDDTHFLGKEIVCTEKFDGECTTLYSDGYSHARSIDSNNHPSRNWVKQYWANKYYMLPDGYRVCGENVYALHSIPYVELPSYFLGFSVWNGEICFSWDDTLAMFSELNIHPVREIYRGVYDEKVLKNISFDTNKQEGFVIRLTDSFHLSDFSTSIAKFVRANHVQTDEHWSQGEIIKNKLYCEHI